MCNIMPYMSRIAVSGLTLSAPDSIELKVSNSLFTSILGKGLAGWPSWGKLTRFLGGGGGIERLLLVTVLAEPLVD